MLLMQHKWARATLGWNNGVETLRQETVQLSHVKERTASRQAE